jgi:hypothetical protein
MTTTTNWFVKHARRYFAVTMGYGFTRAVTFDNDSSKQEYWNKKRMVFEEKEMLFTEKIVRVITNTFAAITVWPVMMGDDFRRLEFAVTGKDPNEYYNYRK